MLFPFYLVRHKFVDPDHSPDPTTIIGEGIIYSNGECSVLVQDGTEHLQPLHIYTSIESLYESEARDVYNRHGHHGHLAIQYVGEVFHLCRECGTIEVTPEPWVTTEGDIIRLCKEHSQCFFDGTMAYDLLAVPQDSDPDPEPDPEKTEPLPYVTQDQESAESAESATLAQ